MRRIEFFFNNSKNIVVEDESDEKLDEYSKKVSTLFESSSVSIFESSSSIVVMRPNNLVSVLVEDMPIQDYDNYSEEKSSEEVEEKTEVVHEDTITD